MNVCHHSIVKTATSLRTSPSQSAWPEQNNICARCYCAMHAYLLKGFQVSSSCMLVLAAF